jgi:hypothetical protein
MVKRAGSCLLAVLAFTGLAFGDGKHERWSAVQQLALGKYVEVKVRGQAGPDGCRLISVSDSTLICIRAWDPEADWDGASGIRLVFPRSAVESVSVLVDAGPERRFWAGAGIGFAIGAALCGRLGPGPLFICGGVGALIGAGFALSPPPSPYGWPRPEPRPTWRQRLVYRAPLGIAAGPAAPTAATP